MTDFNLRHFGLLVLLLTWSGVLSSFGGTPEKVAFSDPKVESLVQAMEKIDRAELGFTPLTTNDQVHLEESSGRAYDVMLHVNGETSRSISFRKTSSGYRWIGEQESHQGPGWYHTVDGSFREHIVVEYQTEPVNGIPTNQLYIRYTGSDTNLSGRDLTLSEIQPVLEKWRQTPVQPQPPDSIDDGFDPLPAMFVLLMLLAVVAGFCLALAIGGICLVGLAIAVAAGIVSTSVLLAVLQRSISTGFRALFLQLGALAGLVIGALATSAVIWLTKGPWDSLARWVAGLILGLLAGLLLGWCFNLAWGRVAQALKPRLQQAGK